MIPIVPRLPYRDEPNLDAEIETNGHSQLTDFFNILLGIAVGATERQLIIHLQVPKDAKPLLSGYHGLHRGAILFAGSRR